MWVCHAVMLVLMSLSNPLFPLNRTMGAGLEGELFNLSSKTIPQCHWFHFGTAVHKNTAFILACTIMTSKALIFLCVFYPPGGMLSSHTLTHVPLSNCLSSFVPFFLFLFFFLNHHNIVCLFALDTSIYIICELETHRFSIVELWDQNLSGSQKCRPIVRMEVWMCERSVCVGGSKR